MLFQFSGGSFVSHTTYPESAVVPVITGLKDTVPAGTFTDCADLFFLRSFYDESVGYVFAPGVGIIEWYGPFHGKRVLLRAVIDGSLISAVNQHAPEGPEWYDIHQNYPNPFNPSTTIRFGLPQRSHVSLAVYNMLGQSVTQLVNGEVEAGYHDVTFDASGLPSGVYFYRLQVRGSTSPRDSKSGAGGYVETRKLCLVR